MREFFLHDERLGIPVPIFFHELELFQEEELSSLLFEWEKIRGSIPDRIYDLEAVINEKQLQLYDEDDFELSCRLNEEIAELASMINDLWIWYRSNHEEAVKAYH